MSSRLHGAVLQNLHRLFEHGSVSGLSEWQLLDRYASRRDESAFEVLMARHGPMVLGVCRRMLVDPHAVEDAFQATFLVLVRKAGSLGEHDAIGHWLYGVACRVALRARCEAARRRSLEVPVGRAEAVARGDDPGKDELAAALDEELGRLPAKYRAPLVLCYLEGLTHEEAASQLHWPIGSVKGRLARARELLRRRLTRRGLVPSAGLLAASQGCEAVAAVSDSLRQATVQAAMQITAGQAAAAVVSASIVGLAEGVISTMFLTKLKVTAILGACGLITVGAWGLAQSSGGNKPGPSSAKAEARESAVHTPSSNSALDLAVRNQALRKKLDRPLPNPLRFQEAPLGAVLKSIKQATQAPGDTGVAIYVEPEGLKEAGVTIDSLVNFDAKDLPLKTALDVALRPLKLAVTTRDGLLVVTSRQEVALIELRSLNDELQRITVRPQGAIAPGRAGGTSPALWLKGMKGHRTVFSENSDDEVDPEDEAKTRAVLDALKKRMEMSFANETPLEDVIKYIKQETKSQELPDGIPIYVDPVGLNEAEKTMTSPITLDLRGVALRESLRLLLKQLGLNYTVKDGLLSIRSDSWEDRPTPILMLAEKAERGELSLEEMNDLIELFKTREQVRRYAAEEHQSPQ